MTELLAASAVTASIVDAEALLDTAVASLVAGVGVTFVASAAIYGFATFSEMRQEGRLLAATGAVLIGAVAALTFAAMIVLGLVVMINP